MDFRYLSLMKSRCIRIMSVIGVSIFLVSCSAPSNPDAEQAASAAASEWLSLVDEGSYADSWQHASELFRVAVTKEQWEASLRGVRTPLGNVVSREVGSMQYVEELPGAPDGQYVVIQFKTSLEFKKSAVETVTPMIDKDGKWRVSGYYIK
jgi:hypothetical protein